SWLSMGDRLRNDEDYECVKQISQGAFGKVFSGYLCESGEQVVIKRGKKQYLQSEYEILKQLTRGDGRSHIVQVFGYDEDRDNMEYSIIMERARCSLDRLFLQVPFRDGLPAVDIVKLVADLGTALGLLLQQQVIHRDIKPQNILVFSGANDPARSQLMFKLCDFGSSREHDQSEACYTIAGTGPFLHPEIFLEYQQHPNRLRMNRGYSAEKCDLWSIGVTLYQASTGRLPWPSVTGAEETRALHGTRPSNAIAAAQLPIGGYRYYDTIRAGNYPRWLIAALSSLIRSQFNDSAYDRFLAQCRGIARATAGGEMAEGRKGTQKRLVLLPALTPTAHADVDERVFPGANIQLHSLFGLPPVSRTVRLSADGITVFGPGQPINMDGIREDTVLVWNEHGQGLGVQAGAVMPSRHTKSREELHLSCVQDCYDLARQCDEVIDAHHATVHIVRRNVERVLARCAELRKWLKSIERNEQQAATTATVAAVMEACNKDMLDRLQSAPEESTKRTSEQGGEIERCGEQAAKLVDDLKQWTPLDERHIANWQESLHRISQLRALSPGSNGAGSGFRMDEKWASTMRKRVEQRLHELRADCEQRVKGDAGSAHVIRSLIAVDATLCESVRKMKETASVVSTVSDQARARVSQYMKHTAGMDEALIRKNLTNSVFAISMLKNNVKKQAEMTRQLEVMMSRLGGGALNGNGISNGILQPTVCNVNSSIVDLGTLTPERSFS
ncbi:hypothetical protein PFISCL1PPCAC_8567, partial [Pristionchus fissidentatus]